MIEENEQVSRNILLESTVALWSALEYRARCPECGGKGINYHACSDEDVCAEACECGAMADDIINRYQETFEKAAREYMSQNQIDPKKVEAYYEQWNYGLLEYLVTPSAFHSQVKAA